MCKFHIDSNDLDLDLPRVTEGLRQHLNDVYSALAAIERIMAWSTPHELAGSAAVCSHGGTLDPTGVGVGQTITANAHALLRSVGHPMGAAEIAAALRTAGVTTRSADFTNSLNSMLSKRRGLFAKTGPKTWGLVEWQAQTGGAADGPKATPLQVRPRG